MNRIAAALLSLCAASASAQDASGALRLPANARLTKEIAEPEGRYALPVGAYAAGAVPTLSVDGAILRQAWRIDARDLATAQLLAPLQDQLTAQGYAILFECQTADCGGFDFRFGTDVLPPPDMYVDLGAFRFLAAQRPSGEVTSLFVSRSPRAGFVQIIRVSPAGTAGPQGTEAEGTRLGAVQAPAAAELPDDFGAALEGQGRVVLTDLDFASGSSELGPGPHASLVALAAYLRDHPGTRVALVGHTDTTGTLDGNIGLSRRRAASVVERLVRVHGVPRAQLDAEGMGYLAPLASNLTPEGREANRRVEVIVLEAP